MLGWWVRSIVALNATEVFGFPEVIKTYDVYLSNGSVPVSVFYEKIKALIEK